MTVAAANTRDTTLYDPASSSPVFNGKTIELNTEQISLSIGAFAPTEPIPAKSTTLSWNERLSYGDHLGFENPILTVTGVINVEDSTPSTPVDGTSVTLKLLLQFLKKGNEYILTDIYDNSKSATPNAGYYRIHSLDSSDNATTVRVMIKSLKVDTAAKNEIEGHLLHYTLELVEVRS